MGIKWGIVGCGSICDDFVSAIKFISSNDHQVVGASARDINRAEEFAKKHCIPKVYDSYEKLAQNKDIDVVYVGILNPDHYPVTKMLLENNKNVLCEKPLGMNSREVNELMSLAKQKNLFLMEAIWSRFFPAYQRLSEIVNNGEIGDINSIHCDIGFEMHAKRILSKKLGGGCLLDLGIYAVQFLLFILGRQKPTAMHSIARLNEEGVDIGLSTIFQFRNGAIAAANVSSENKLNCEAVVYGTKGTLKVCEPFWCPNKIILNSKIEEFPLPAPILPYRFNFTNSIGLQYEAEEVKKCLENGLKESPLLPALESKLIHEIMDQIRSEINVIYANDEIYSK